MTEVINQHDLWRCMSSENGRVFSTRVTKFRKSSRSQHFDEVMPPVGASDEVALLKEIDCHPASTMRCIRVDTRVLAQDLPLRLDSLFSDDSKSRSRPPTDWQATGFDWVAHLGRSFWAIHASQCVLQTKPLIALAAFELFWSSTVQPETGASLRESKPFVASFVN